MASLFDSSTDRDGCTKGATGDIYKTAPLSSYRSTVFRTSPPLPIMPTVQYFIAMYRTGVTMQYHWALIVTEGGFPSSREYIRMFDIKHKDVILGKSSSFMGLVAFPPYTDSITTRHSVEEFLEEQPAIPLEDDDFKIDVSGWNCAKWVLHLFTRQGHALGLEFVGSMHRGDTLFAEILKHARKLEGGRDTEGKEWFYGQSAVDETRVKYVPFPPDYVKV